MSITALTNDNVSAETLWTDIASLDNRRLQAEIRSLASYTAAAMCRMLLLVAELDRRGTWAERGVQSCAHWLSWQCGFSANTAREHVRVARVLATLPLTIAEFAKGELTYAKVRAISRVATPQNEELLVQYAREATASQLERIVRGYRRANETKTANEAHESRSVEWSYQGEGVHVLTIRMTAEQRAVMQKAHELAEANVSAETPRHNRGVDAFVAMAETTLAVGLKSGKDKYLVNLSVSAETLADDADGECTVDSHDVSAETSRRLSCDAPVVASLIDAEGAVLKMGRKSRLFTGASRAAVMKRDKGTCIDPGCENRKWIDVHHILHWCKGGHSDPENGAVLCDYHHRLVHEGGYSLDHNFVFRTPGGEIVERSPKLPGSPAPTRLKRTVANDACVSTGNGAPFNLDLTVMNLCAVS